VTGYKFNRKGKIGRIYTLIVVLIILLAALCKEGGLVPDILNPTVESTKLPDGELSLSTVKATPDKIPEYSGQDIIELSGNKPNFTEADLSNITGENYEDLDLLGRCKEAFARLSQDMMPTQERGNIGHVRPTGWVQEKYPGIVNSKPPYLYNRCHLIAYALTGENANERNLITGTRYMNTELMLPYELQVMRYLDSSTNHVLYRVTPYFKGNELLARGVEMEAYSIEDDGKGICFHVFVYNVQPGIDIDYETGESRVEGE